MLFIHGPIPSLENCIFESVLTPLIFQVATKGLVLDAHRVKLNMLKAYLDKACLRHLPGILRQPW